MFVPFEVSSADTDPAGALRVAAILPSERAPEDSISSRNSCVGLPPIWCEGKPDSADEMAPSLGHHVSADT
jgi:hypothetical protein